MSTGEIKKFEGKWKVYKNENFDAFLKEMGFNIVMRKMASSTSPTNEFIVDGDTIKIKIDAGFKKMEETHTLNTEGSRKSEEGKNIKTMATCSDGKLIVVNTPVDSKEKTLTVVREIEGDDLIMTMSRGDVVARRFFNKI